MPEPTEAPWPGEEGQGEEDLGIVRPAAGNVAQQVNIGLTARQFSQKLNRQFDRPIFSFIALPDQARPFGQHQAQHAVAAGSPARRC